ncbi:ZYBA0S05-03664g1_1 [Zygosaccharomyces bailii CLIB 213]|uniref:ZYBA0S05-03664g1_1 n=1 Tax=Zygosaccharomyces bailii (strain CLIB 213 / ATCC 58445 / CBS 680 / BCRC 21525 / NBRC 1098 / NCYC 1416 / NRRL Y-2227) TaxID=1333698 RepID=A0A8J2T713_ZYGB2|nr:ZYBA0S05-03664g1_1 [Zygosaccharomyces bailii CLIB 213]
MDNFDDSEEEDNNPFIGTNHLYASGIAAVEDGEDDFVPREVIDEEEEPGNESTEQNVEALDTTVVHIKAPYESYVSLSMSMANNVSNSITSEGDEEIRIIEAGEYKDPWGKRAIGYVIKFKGQEVVRRYSEFDMLRHALIRLLPTIVIPPIPSKHPLIKYLLSPLSVENDAKIIEKRKRRFSFFLKNCIGISEIRDHIVFRKFLDPEYVWKNVLSSPPIAILPVNNLLAPPLNPTKPSPLHLLLPGPTSISRLDLAVHSGSSMEIETQFAHLEAFFKKSRQTFSPLYKMIRQHRLHFRNLSSFFAELGAYYNAFSLEDNVLANDRTILQIKSLASGIEKVGHAFDVNYVSSEILVDNILSILEEPLGEMLQFLDEAHRVLQFRKLKQMQYQIIETTITRRETRIKNLQEAQTQIQRLEEVLHKNAQESPTIANAVRHLSNSLHGDSFLPADEPQSDQEQVDQEQVDQAQVDQEQVAQEQVAQEEQVVQEQSDQQHSDQLQLDVQQSDQQQPDEQRSDEQQPGTESSSIHRPMSQARLRKKTRRSRTHETEPHLLTEAERQEEIRRLQKEVNKLRECFKLISKDINDVNQSSLDSLQHLSHHISTQWGSTLKNFSKSMVNWLSECLKVWKNAKMVVDSIEA